MQMPIILQEAPYLSKLASLSVYSNRAAFDTQHLNTEMTLKAWEKQNHFCKSNCIAFVMHIWLYGLLTTLIALRRQDGHPATMAWHTKCKESMRDVLPGH